MVEKAAQVSSNPYDKYADLLIARKEAMDAAQLKAAKLRGAVPTETPEEKPEILIFGKQVQYAQETPKMTATAKPVAEHAKAAVASSQVTPQQIFVQNGEGKIVASNAHHTQSGATELPSALSGAEDNKQAGDKKGGNQNSFTSDNKDIKDIRRETLEKMIG